MIQDSIFTIHTFTVEADTINEPIYLIPFGDIHRFAPLCDEHKWLEFIEWAKKKKNCYFMGMGDYLDFLSCRERRELLEAALHESTYQTIEDMMDSQVTKLYNEIKFMEGKVVGLIEGNHYGSYQTGMTTTQELCRRLRCKYLGISSFIRLKIFYKGKASAIDIWTHHGKGAGRAIGSSLNTVEQMSQISDAQIMLMGHTHRKSVAIKTRLCLGGAGAFLSLHHRKILMACTGSFLKGYVDEKPSYVARAAMPPTDMGVVKIELTPKRERKNGKDLFSVDIHASL